MGRSGYTCSSTPTIIIVSKTLAQADVWRVVHDEFDELLHDVTDDPEVANALTLSCSTQTSLSKACTTHDDFPDRHRALDALTLVKLDAWEARANHALQKHASMLPHGSLTLAIDTHRRPFHGVSLEDLPMEEVVRKGRAKDGTTRFFEWATLAVVIQDRRLTIAVHLMRPKESKTGILQILLKEAEKLQLHVRLLLLDAWFSDSFVTDWCRDTLSLASMTVLSPLQVKGKKGRRVLRTRGSKVSWYEFASVREEAGKKVKKTVRVRVHVIVTQARGRRRGRKQGLAAHGFIVLGKSVPLRATRRLYHQRSRIEKTYALLERVVPRTTSRNAGLRFLLVLAGFVVQNAWTWLRWERVSVPRRGRGGRIVPRQAFEFLDLVRFVAQHAARAFHATTRVAVTWLKGRPKTWEVTRS